MSTEKLPRGLRNNNPGNIRNSDSVKWQGEVDATAKKDFSFEEFKDRTTGYRALLKLLRNYHKLYGCRTIADYIRRWAPENENNTSGYIIRVCKEMQVPNTFVPDPDNKETMIALASAISLVENGVPAVLSEIEAGWDAL